METVTIGKLAAKGGVGVETVRYYQRRGLLAEPQRDAGIRRYGDDDLRRLRFIRSAQAAGFTLEEIGELLDLDAVDDRIRARQLAKARIAAIDAKIAEMQSARAALAKLASECANSSVGACPIIAAFEHQI
ncbi:MerR family transcriptional regulator [Novosphingobium profundi]|uniref:MerR family transcriptional regulator n=1 Tax=Novosphingobium profundi TaxID=1774954 RepID=UPI001BDB5CCE|nr:MerR family transcriptional regulator [Novosphingobium profundi]MBT0671751.1 MerR family transcriptional regulator [Novosphingobium profundi]